MLAEISGLIGARLDMASSPALHRGARSQIIDFVRREFAYAAINDMLRVLFSDDAVWFAVAPRDIVGVVRDYLAVGDQFLGFRHSFEPPRLHADGKSYEIRYEYDVLHCPSGPMRSDYLCDIRKTWAVNGRISREVYDEQNSWGETLYSGGYCHGVCSDTISNCSTGEVRSHWMHGRELAREIPDHGVVTYYALDGSKIKMDGFYRCEDMLRICYDRN